MIIDERSFEPPFYLKNKHLQTILPALFRKIDCVSYERERLTTWDNDFIDLDWSKVGSKKLVILFHGLEGNSNSQYIKGLVKVLNQNKIDTVSVNFRGCSGEPNKLLPFYHSGKSDDIQFVIDNIHNRDIYKDINLVGFSLGGNASLKYLGSSPSDLWSSPQRGEIPSILKKAVIISVPCDLKSSAIALSKGFNRIYIKRFLKRLNAKARQKELIYPDATDYQKLYRSRDFLDFDNLYTAPIHGFKDAEEYWQKCSGKQFIKNITTPTIIINAQNDPFLPKECYPIDEYKNNQNVELLTPKHGGHVGFPKLVDGLNYYEKVVLEFIS